MRWPYQSNRLVVGMTYDQEKLKIVPASMVAHLFDTRKEIIGRCSDLRVNTRTRRYRQCSI